MDERTYLKLYGSYHHVQDIEEFWWLIRQVQDLSPHVIMEVGVHHGGSLKFWEQILQPGDLLIGVDYEPQLDWDVSKSDRRIIIYKGRSEDSSTVQAVRESLGGREADFIFLDGSHEYSVVSWDFENYSPLLRAGGLLAIHDIKTEQAQAGKFFRELEAKYPDATAKMMKVQGTGIWCKHG